MPSNIEIKAKAINLKATQALVEKLTGSPPQTLFQEDIFYTAQNGRLKLRILAEDCGELIYYERPDSAEPKQSVYEIYRTSHPHQLREVLSSSLDVSVIVKKKRIVYLVGQTRVHLDEVEGLGDFVELEVVLNAGQNPADGHEIALGLMGELQINEAHLISCAYADLLMEKSALSLQSPS